MNSFKDRQLIFWFVNLGNMYYAGCLLRKKIMSQIPYKGSLYMPIKLRF